MNCAGSQESSVNSPIYLLCLFEMKNCYDVAPSLEGLPPCRRDDPSTKGGDSSTVMSP